MALLKKEYTQQSLHNLSLQALNHLEQLPLFRQSNCFAIYHALKGELQTSEFIDKWHNKKNILLPIVKGDDIVLQSYMGRDSLKSGAFGILEPTKTPYTTTKPDIIIIPGIAFDKQYNRLGRGKGYYDRFLNNLQIPKVGLCFSFQLIDKIPSESFDIKMDYIVTNMGVISYSNELQDS
jgi:5,10-methenyltetrahydrofolate synthetase